MKRYTFRKHSRYSNEDAQAVGSFIETKFGSLNVDPKKIVNLARPRNSPIHKYFEWDDTLAAEKFRLSQARNLINALYVSVRGETVRAYESVIVADRSSYVNIDEISQSDDLVNQVIQKAYQEALYWKERYQLYRSTFGEVFESIDKLKGVLDGPKKERRSSRNNQNTRDRKKDSKDNDRRRRPTSRL